MKRKQKIETKYQLDKRSLAPARCGRLKDLLHDTAIVHSIELWWEGLYGCTVHQLLRVQSRVATE